ncbi:MAG TPA: DUF1800 family protein, partial [Casimicrobiaceae bacterium]
YLYEGPVYYAPYAAGAGNAALFRFYNTRTHAYFYTDNPAERDQVLNLYPWFQLQGIGFYVFTSLTPPGSTDDSALKVSLTVQPVTATNINLTATAIDTSGFVNSIDFTMDGAPIGSVSRAPFTVNVSVTPGTHAFTATAHDSTGATRSSEPASYTLAGPTLPKPVVSLSVSSAALQLGQPVTLAATATETSGTIAKVDFYAAGVLLFESTAAPYSYTYTPSAAGGITYSAIATDGSGQSTTSTAVGVSVSSPSGPPATTPKVTLAATPTTITLGQPVTFTATATEDGGTIKSVSFYMAGTLLKTVTAAPYTLLYTPGVAGGLAFTAVATDVQGLTGTSGNVGVNVNPTVGAVPKIALASSATSISVGAPVTLTATASETGGTIKQVTFYSGTKALSTQTAAPYAYTYTPAAGGLLNFSAVATDTKNVVATSATIAVTVNAALVSALKVTISSTSAFTQVPATITLTANPTAATGTTISRVDFLRNGAVIGSVMVKPYTLAVSLTTANQTYAFTARATDNLNATASSAALNVVTTPTPVVTAATQDQYRLLTQATFGPTPADIASVQSLGVAGWIDNQFAKPQTGYPNARYNHIQLSQTPDCASADPAGNAYPANSAFVECVRDQLSLNMVERDFFTNAVSGGDQLRQRVAWALSQILVTSAVEQNLSIAYVMSRYQNILFANAFGNYETLLQQVSLSPAMGDYLDAVNNDRPDGNGRVPNENYAREVMQLFSIGLNELNEDGTPLLDANGDTIATYDQDDIKEMARVFTGWTYANADGSPPAKKNNPYYATPMANFPGTATTGHDEDPKTLLGDVALLAGQSALQDLNSAVHTIFMHPNTPVFVSKQLIQKLVTGNPSQAYVQRIVNVFKNDGSGQRGNLHAVVRAILLDPEARGSGDKGDSFGSLREPVFVITSLLRSLSGITDGNSLSDLTGALGQRVYYSPTVFNYFQPDETVEVQAKNLNEPEFGIHDSNTAFGRANLVYRLVYSGIGEDATINNSVGTHLNTQQFESVANDPVSLVNQVSLALTANTIPAPVLTTISNAVAAIATSTSPTSTYKTQRAQMAIYLIASSYYYQVQH